MALDFRPVPFLFGKLDQKVDPKLSVPGNLTLLENVVRNKSGRYQKRFGHDALPRLTSTGSETSGGLALATFSDELLQLTASQLLSYSVGAEKWFAKSDVTSVSSTLTQLVRNTHEQSEVDASVANGVRVVAYRDSRGGVWATALDEETGTTLVAESELRSGASKPSVLALGNTLLVFYVSGGNLYGRSLDSTSPIAFGDEVSLATTLDSTDNHYDVTPFGSNIIFAYNTSGNEIRVGYITPNLVVGSPVTALPSPVFISEAADNCISVACSTEHIYVSFHSDTDGLCRFILFDDLTTYDATEVVDATTSPIATNVGQVIDEANDRALIVWETFAASAGNAFVTTCEMALDGTLGTPAVLVRSVGLAAKPFLYNEEFYVPAVHDSALQATYFAVREDGFIAARFAPGQAGGLVTSHHLGGTFSQSVSQFAVAVRLKTQLQAEEGVLYSLTGLGLVSFEFDSDSTYQNSELGGNLHIASGILQAYDGVSVVEHGFFLFPEGVAVGSASASGGAMSNGTYNVVAVYEWTDAQGQIHRSAPSIPIQFTLSGGGSAQKQAITVPTLRLTAKTGIRSDVVVTLYQTENAGTVYYKATSVTAPTYNDPSADSVSIDLTLADSSLVGRELLYTTGAVVENIAAPSCKLITTFGNRSVISGLEDGDVFMVSKKHVAGEGVSFSDVYTYRVDRRGGPRVTALGVVDDKLILFRDRACYYLVGSGPNLLGNQDDYNGPNLIADDVGCPFPNSVVLTPVGLMFKSEKGFYRLDGSMRITPQSYVGAPVEDYNDLTVQSAVLIEDKNQVRFTTTEGRTLVYNYHFDEWYTFTGLESYDALSWRGTYTLLRSDADIWTEGTSFRDAGQFVQMRFGPGWLSLAGLQGFQRVRSLLILGDYIDAHQLRVKVGYDFSESFTEVKYFDAAGQIGDSSIPYGESSPYGSEATYGTGDLTYNFEARLKRQKCTSIRFTIEDVEIEGSNESFSINAFGLYAGMKRGPQKFKKAKKF